MRAEVHGDELVITLEVGEIPDRPADRTLAARLPRSASGIAAGVMGELDSPKEAPGPVTIRAVTVKVVRTVVIGSETLMLDPAKETFA